MNKPLYNLADEYQEILQGIMECDELTEEQVNQLESVKDSIQDKAVNVAAFIKNLEVETDGIEKALKSMKERYDRSYNKIEYLKNYLKNNLERCNINEVKSPYFDVRIKVNPPSVYVMDENLIPPDYYNETIMRKLDKIHLSNDLKNNMIIPGVILERRSRLEIK